MADKVFNIKFNVDGNVGPLKSALDGLKGSFEKLKLPDNLGKNFISTFDKLENEVKNFEAITSKGFQNIGDIGKAEKSYEKITTLFSRLQQEVAHIKGVDPNKLLPPQVLQKTKDLQKAWLEVQATMSKSNGAAVELEKVTTALDKQKNKLSELQNEYDKLSKLNTQMGSQRGNLTKTLSSQRAQRENILSQMSALEGQKGGKASGEYKVLAADLKVLNEAILANEKQWNQLGLSIQKNKTTMTSLSGDITKVEGNITRLEADFTKLTAAAAKTPEGLERVRKILSDLTGVNLEKIPKDIQGISSMIGTLHADQLNTLKQQFDDLGAKAKNAENPVRQVGVALRETAQQGSGLNERARDLQRLADQAKYFFSVTNSIQLFKRTIRSAFNTIKELDEVMTQAAVVTKFDVSDMWKQLPEYAKRADELGVSLKGTYEAATLYYQQGLETEQVIGVSNETLKMAKIAGMDYATATDYMTSALRGFNMEVNEASAQRVNDVYSQLAAKSASNTEELSIAMSKTAPLAHNAGMEIESTAAILANMIETTREAPETLGTAMKTVIARFQELKKAPDQIGEVDGEIVDANKIETALRSIGVALRDSQGQFRDFDDVIFDISAKWNTLDKNTQRYIATIAAGSRQQSRFIAMVGDYDRTMELVEMANNSAGASEAQFAKTQDSLASKLERLKTAWAEFTMGIANNQIIKAAIDGLTLLLKGVNELTKALSGGENGSGFLKSVINTGALIIGIKGARAVLNGFFAFILNTSKTAGVTAGANIGAGISKGLSVDSITDKIDNLTELPKNLFQEAKIFTGKDGIFNGLLSNLQKDLDDFDLEKSIGKLESAVDFKEAIKEGFDLEGLEGEELDFWKNLGESYSEAMVEGFNIEPSSLSDFFDTYKELVDVTELSNEEKEVAAALTDLNIDSDLAATMAKTGLTKAEIDEIAASVGENEADRQAIRLKLQEMAATKGLEQQERRLATTRVASAKASFAKLGQSIASFITSPLGIALAALAAIAITVVAIKANSLEGRLNQAKKAAQEAAESAETAKKAYDDLLNGQQTYNELQDKLSELTYGTKEFAQALLEANAQVLELKQQFSDLELGIGEQGQLIILPESWENVVEKTRKTALARQGVQLSADQDVADIEYEKNRKNINSQYIDQIKEEYGISANRRMMVQRFQNDVSYDQYSDWDKRLEGLDTIAQARQNELDMLELTYQKETQARRMSQISPWTAELENAQTVNSMIATQYDRLYQLWSKEQGERGLTTKEAYQEEYAKNFVISDEELKSLSYDQLAEGLFQLSFEDIGKQYDEIISKYNDTSMKGLVDAFSGQVSENFFDFFKDINLADIAKLDNNTLQEHLEKNLEGTETTLEQVAEDFGFVFENGEADIAGFLNTLKEGAAEAEQAWNLTQQQTSKNLEEAGINFNTNTLTQDLGIDKTKFFSNYFNNAIDSGFEIFEQKTIAHGLKQILEGNNLEDVQKYLGNIDFSNSITAFNQLTQASKEAAEAGKADIAVFLETQKTFSKFSKGNMFKDFYQSGALDEVKEQLDEIADADGKITGAGIEKLKDSCSGLSNYLETGQISAIGLAEAINLINSGSPIQAFTDDIITALSEMDTLSNRTQKMFNYIDDFDYGKDQTEGLEGFKSNFDEFEELRKKGIKSGNAIEGLFDFYTSDNLLSETDFDTVEEQLAAVSQEWQKMVNTDFSKNKTLRQWNDFFGFSDGKEITATSDQLLQMLGGEDGPFKYAGEEARQAFLDAYLNYLPSEYRQAIEENDKKHFVDNYADVIAERDTTTVNGTQQGQTVEYTTVTQEEIDLVVKETGESPETVIQKIKEKVGDGVEVLVVPTVDENGIQLTGEELATELENAFRGVGADFNQVLEDAGVVLTDESGNVTVNMEKAVELAEQLKIPPDAFEAALKAIDKLKDAEFVYPETSEYEQTLQAVQEAINNMDYSQITVGIKGAIEEGAKATSTLETNIETAGSNASGKVSSDLDTAVSKSRTMNIKIPATTMTVTLNIVGAATGTLKNRSNLVTNSKRKNPVKEKASFKESSLMSAANGYSKYGGLRKSQYALTGEEGVELAYNEDGAFFLGQKGPEIAYLKKGTVIYSNKDTEQIVKNKQFGKKIGSFANVINKGNINNDDSSTPKAASKSKNKTSTPKSNAKSATKAIKEGNEESEKWENSVDFIYNLLEQINKQARIREKLEKRYQRLLKNNKTSLKDIRDITRQQLANLQAQRALEEERIKKREEEMRDTLDKNKDLSQYLQYDFDTQMINVDWDKVNAISNKDTGEAFEKFLSEVERIRDDIWEGEDSIEDIDDEVNEINERGRDQRAELEERIIDALKQQREQQIEEQENLNKTIEDANSKLIDSIDANISQMRKDREREKTRTDLEDKERRLAYMRQDTTGGNAVAIKQLEKELNDAKESYVDTLVDDRLQEIKNQNEEARIQREKQIELMKSRLEYDEKHGLLADKANEMITKFIQDYGGKDNFSVADTDIYTLLKEADSIEAMGLVSQGQWMADLKSLLLEVGGNKGGVERPEDLLTVMKSMAGVNEKEQFRTYEESRNKRVEVKTAFMDSYDIGSTAKLDSTKNYMEDINKILAKDNDKLTLSDWNNLFKFAGLRDQKIAGLDLDSLPYEIEEPDTLGYILKKFAERYTLGAYATGGLVDSTGPAWLDGTKTRPEMVLNTQQTAAFIQLKDILSQLSLSDSAPTSDNYNFDIDIHVDQISNDYDVDRMAEQLERSLYEKAMYRNVNSLRFMK